MTEILQKLYLELATVVPDDCISVREKKLRLLLRETRRYIVKSKTAHAKAVLSDIDLIIPY